MSFDNVQFPPDISYGSQGGIEYDTTVVVVKSGQESRNQNWSAPRNKWDVSSGVKSKEDMEDLITFFRNRCGRARSFRFKDWLDFQATGQVIGTGTGSEDTYQLIKTYNDGSFVTTRTITKPVTGTLTVFLDATPVAEADYTIDFNTGIIVFDSNVTNGVVISATFEFDIPVRFDTDSFKVNYASFDGLSSEVSVIEVRGE